MVSKNATECIENNMKDGGCEETLEKIWRSVNSFEKNCQLTREELYDILEYKSFEQIIFVTCYLGCRLE